MEHIRKTAKDFPFLYYQRVFIKGYIALDLPLIMAVRSEVADGYIYIRRRTKGLRIRDLDNTFVRGAGSGQPIGVKANPVRDIDVGNCIAADVGARGRDDTLTWLHTKDDLPRIINDETFTELLACVPVKNPAAPPVGKLSLIVSYVGNFLDWYRMITGDVSMTGPGHWSSHIPMYSECIENISACGDKLIDEIVVDVEPKRFSPSMFQVDLEPNETATVNATTDGLSHEQRIAHYLATGKTVPAVHKRFAEIVHLAQETKDWALVALCMFPVFEQYFDGFMREVGVRSSAFAAFLEKRRKKGGNVYIGERITWLPIALIQLGYAPASAGWYMEELRKANGERVQTVHFNKQPTFEDSMNTTRILTNTVLLCETALGNESPYVVALQKADTSITNGGA